MRKRVARRLVIIERITKTAQRLNVSERESAHRIELWRILKKFSMDKLSKEVKARPELWGVDDRELHHLA
jgi:hypothetical protein